MVDKTDLHKISKFTIGPDEFKRIEIYLNVLENKLVFIGLCAEKTTGVRVWHEFATRTIDLNAYLEPNESQENLQFQTIVEEIYSEIVEKEKTLEVVRELFKNVDSVEFKEED